MKRLLLSVVMAVIILGFANSGFCESVHYLVNATYDGDITIGDGKNINLDTTTGTKIGTATDQKMGFFNATPVIQQTGNALDALETLGLVASPTLTNEDVGLSSVTNDAQVKGLATAVTDGNFTSWGADGYTVADSGYSSSSFEVPLTFSYSLDRDGNTITLTNDTASPGANKVYGTDGDGARGWFDQSTASYFNRTDTTLSPSTANDNLDMGTGSISGGAATFSNVTNNGDNIMKEDAKMILNSDDGSDTYIVANANDTVSFFKGGTEYMRFD